jgi:adenylate cyclase
VGNIGTPLKYKYGPLGDTVNRGSRVEGATKHLKVPVLITGATHDKLRGEFATRKLTPARLTGMTRPTDLYELVADPPPDWASLRVGYGEALTAFLDGDARLAARRLGNLLADHREDGPSLLLLQRSVNALVAGKPDYERVWEPPGK